MTERTLQRSSSPSSRPPAQGCMGATAACGARRVREQTLTVLVYLWVVWAAVVAEAQSIEFTVKPAGFSSDVSPAFEFLVLAGADGVDPCATSQCSFQCKLDQGVAQDCSGRTFSASNLTDGSHILTISANTSNGTSLAPSIYSWAVDTVSPTASVVTNSLYTSAINITINITFSEDCSGLRTFECANVSSCDLVVRGPAVVLPSTLVILSPGVAYSVQVALSTQVDTGKVTLTTVRQICNDAAGNRYQRSNDSTKVVRFSRIQPTLNLWTAIPNSQVEIGDQFRTVQANNGAGDFPIYLDFSEPILGTAAEIQGLLNSSHGVLLPRERKSRGNRRFAFSLSLNDTRTAAVTITLPGNTTASRYGVPVVETATVSFLYDIENPEVVLSTNSRAHTRDRLLPVVVQFSKPVFSFNNSGVTLNGAVLRSFREISKTTYALVVSASEGSSTVGVSVSENRTLDVAGNPNVASSTLQIKHYSSTPAISVALYSFVTAGLLGTAVFSGALAISSANLAAAGAVLGRSTSCVGADASRNLLGMAGHMQVLALTSFLAVSLPVEYVETANGLQWLIPHVSTPWQKNEDTNYTTSFASNVQANLTLNVRRSLISASHGSIGEFQQQALFSTCRMMHHWPTQYGNLNCSLYSESTYRSDTSMEDFLSRNQEPYESHVQGRRRLDSNGTEFGPAMVAAEYETYFLNQSAVLSRLKDELLATKYTGWSDFQRNIFWLAVVCGSLILLHVLLLLFLRWRIKTPLHGALSFPRFELFLLILALPAVCQASAFVIRGGTKAGIAVGIVLLIIPALLLFMTMLLLIFGIFLGKRVQYKELRPHLKQDEKPPPPPPTGKPLSLLTGAGYPGKWTRNEATSVAFIPRYGILFEDRKGPRRLVTTMDDTNSNKNTDGLRPSEEHGERRAYTALGCFQSAYVLVDISRRIALGVVFGAFRVTDESWRQVSLVLAVTAAQLFCLVLTKPFQRRFVQVVETVSLLCDIGIFIAAMVILSQDRPYESHWGIGVFMLALFVLSFFAQITNEWFALIRQLLSLSNTEEIAPKKSLEAFALGLLLPILPRSRWPTTTPLPNPSPTAKSSEVAQNAGTQYQVTSPRPEEAHQSPRAPAVSKSSKPVVVSHWPGEDLQEWARQNSIERRRETELVVNPMVQEIVPADAVFMKYHDEASTSTVVSRSLQRRSPRVHSDSDIVLSEGEFCLDSPEPTYSRQHSIEVGPVVLSEGESFSLDSPKPKYSRQHSIEVGHVLSEGESFSLDSPKPTYSRQHSIEVGPVS